MGMTLDESDDKYIALECEGLPFQYEQKVKHMVEKSVIDYTKSFWGEGLTIRTAAAGAC
jgi:Fe-S cluster assembly iron-binding protein IscA